MRMLLDEFDCVAVSVSCTTRKPRGREVDGMDYHFLTKEEFQQRIQAGDFLENAEVFGEYYGTSRQYVMEQQKKGKHVFLVIDTQGARQLMEQIEAVFIFLSPPSLEELQLRLEGRRTDSPEQINRRLAWAEQELEAAPNYDYLIVNDELHTAYAILRSIVIAEEHKVRS